VHGGDAALGAAVAANPGAPIHFVPDATSDLARALGLGAGATVDAPARVDLLDLSAGPSAVNMLVLGPAPDRLRRTHRRRRCRVEVDGRVLWDGPASTVLVATGEYLRHLDVVPKGHPGDGRLEVQVYALAPGQRVRMRRRLATGTHVPHPEIVMGAGTRACVQWDRPVSVEVDGVARDEAAILTATIRPAGLTLV
jgi:diacylglycerol kinase family enzyme